MPKHMTQAGLNRVMWKMIAALGGKFTVSEREINKKDDEAINIQHDPSTKTFILTLCKVKSKEKSNLIFPNYN